GAICGLTNTTCTSPTVPLGDAGVSVTRQSTSALPPTAPFVLPAGPLKIRRQIANDESASTSTESDCSKVTTVADGTPTTG
ncbi:MAG: hypothetical protein P8I25_10160, partial [Ilumatobacter sp.]|nr:hypothetical protein [Ilumatobacter sp.]